MSKSLTRRASSSQSATPKPRLLWEWELSSLPSSPGVYSFLDKNDKILYVGKAKNLKNRVRSYAQYQQLVPRIKKLVTSAVKIKYEVLESDLEAILIEAELIRTHQPFFNIRLKDDKTPIYLVITNERFSRVLKKRKTDLPKLSKARNTKAKTILGPFPSGYKLNEVLKIARKIFPWCQNPESGRQCFYYHLDQCSGACVGKISATNYQAEIKDLIDFLRGKKKTVLKNLKEKMKNLANQEKFEEAQIIKNQISNIKTVTSKTYRLKPNLILPGLGQTIRKQALLELNKILKTYLPLPRKYNLERIEGYDVSNIQGKNAAVSMVVFTNGKSNKSNYRLFNIKTLDTPNDYRMMSEALARRQNHKEWGSPNLIVIDGGKGQVRAVLKVWQWDTPVVGLVKNPDRLVIPTKLDEKNPAGSSRQGPRGKKIEWKIIKLNKDHPSLKILQQIRDESHRFAKNQWSKRQLKGMLK